METPFRIFFLLCFILITVLVNHYSHSRLSIDIWEYNEIDAVISQEDSIGSDSVKMDLVSTQQVSEETAKELWANVPKGIVKEEIKASLENENQIYYHIPSEQSRRSRSEMVGPTNSTSSDNLEWMDKIENENALKADENYEDESEDNSSDDVIINDSEHSEEETPTPFEEIPVRTKRRFLRRRLPRNHPLAATPKPQRKIRTLWKGSDSDSKERQRLMLLKKNRRQAISKEKALQDARQRGIHIQSLHPDPRSIARCKRCRLFIGMREERYHNRNPLQVPSTNRTDVTIVSATTPQRLGFIPFLLKRWEGRFSIVVKSTKEEEPNVVNRIVKMDFPERVQIILFIVKRKELYYDDFPVNLLRNIGIVHIHTSHYLVLDMDMWPAHNLYSEIQQLPDSILQSPTAATIVPAFFLKKKPILEQCDSLLSCAKESERHFPKSRGELLNCLKTNECILYKENTITHRYINKDWFRFPAEKRVVRMACLTNRFQEPYILLRYSPTTLFYNERFINYGCNKVQLIDHLRHLGYKFFILTNSFAMDIVHPDSKFRQSYISSLHGGNSPVMRVLCYDYQEQLDQVYPVAKNQTKICRVQSSVLYKSI